MARGGSKKLRDYVGSNSFGSTPEDIISYLRGLSSSSKKRDRNRGLAPTQNEVAQMALDRANELDSRSWQEDMYNKYQSPQALMEQYKAAGINPAMVAGGSMPDMSVQSSPQAAPSMGGSEQTAVDIVSQLIGVMSGVGNVANQAANTYGNIKDINSEVQQRGVQNEKIQAETLNINKDTEIKGYEAEIKRVEAAYSEIMADLDKKETQQRINNLIGERNKISSEISVNNTRIRLMDSQIDLNIKGLDKMDAEMVVLGSQNILNNAKAAQLTQLLPLQKKLIEADTKLKGALTETTKAQAMREKAQTLQSLISAMADYEFIKAGYAQKLVEKMGSEISRNNFGKWCDLGNAVVGNLCRVASLCLTGGGSEILGQFLGGSGSGSSWSFDSTVNF